MPENEPVLIKNVDLVATSIPSTNGIYNLTFRSTGGVTFTYDGTYIRLTSNTNIGWTRVIYRNGGGFVKLDTIRTNDTNQQWITSNGSIMSPDGRYMVSLATIGGLFYPILVRVQDMNSCKFSFPEVSI